MACLRGPAHGKLGQLRLHEIHEQGRQAEAEAARAPSISIFYGIRGWRTTHDVHVLRLLYLYDLYVYKLIGVVQS